MKKLIMCASLLLLGGCEDRGGAEDAVRATMKDPDSARFGEFYYNSTTKKGCLAVNGKNSMGGYTGEQQAYVEETSKGWRVSGIAPIDMSSCRTVHADSAS